MIPNRPSRLCPPEPQSPDPLSTAPKLQSATFTDRSDLQRRFWAPASACLLALALIAAGCGNSSDSANTDGPSTSGSQATADTAATQTGQGSDSTSDDAGNDHNETSEQTGVPSGSETPADPANYDPIEGCLGRDVAFAPYASVLAMSCDDEFLYIETDNLADHEMMVGITAWNGQVPLPQLFYDANSWAIPLNPVYNSTTTETPGLGPIAVAINGVMIFNPTQQSGIYSLQTDPNLIGELDHCGGHSGRGDDYHYHIAPTCLEEEQLGVDPGFDGVVAYSLDGYAVYPNSAIPDGAELDECGGLGTTVDDYRYFASADYPYVNGCFRGDFDMDLQPHAPGIREIENGTPQQIEITALFTDDDGKTHMEYLASGVTLSVNYIASGTDCFEFEFIDDVSTGIIRRTETYCRG